MKVRDTRGQAHVARAGRASANSAEQSWQCWRSPKARRGSAGAVCWRTSVVLMPHIATCISLSDCGCCGCCGQPKMHCCDRTIPRGVSLRRSRRRTLAGVEPPQHTAQNTKVLVVATVVERGCCAPSLPPSLPRSLPPPLMACAVEQPSGVNAFYLNRIDQLELRLREKTHDLQRLQALRNELNGRVRDLREELQLLHEPASYVGKLHCSFASAGGCEAGASSWQCAASNCRAAAACLSLLCRFADRCTAPMPGQSLRSDPNAASSAAGGAAWPGSAAARLESGSASLPTTPSHARLTATTTTAHRPSLSLCRRGGQGDGQDQGTG